MTIHKKNQAKFFWGAPFIVPILIASLAGCSIPFLKPKEPQKAIGSTLKHDPQSGKITQAGLQAEVFDIADQFVLAFWQAMDEIIRTGVDPKTRAVINYSKVLYSAAAMSIAAGRNPAANFLDMLVFISIGRMVMEDYWVPKVYGSKGQRLLTAYRKLEKEIWAMAASVLSPDQQDSLRSLIKTWRAAHPRQYYVADVRLSDFARLRGASPLAREKETHGILAEVEKTLVKVDEAFLLAERAMFYLERAPRILTLQTELIMDQATTNPEVQRALNNVVKAVDSFADLTRTVQTLPKLISTERQAVLKQFTDWADTEREKLWKDLEKEEPRLKGMLSEVREILLAGTELAKAAGALATQFKPDSNAPQAPPGQPLDYIQALQQATETVKQTTLLVKSLDDFVVGENAEQANLVKVFRQVNTETRAILNHTFYLGLILIAVFLIGLVAALVSYQYFTRRLLKSSRT
jgi:hypothetical protein